MTDLSARNLHLSGRLENVDVSVSKGLVTAIVGPNGAGKSSLLACLAGLLKPTSGVCSLGGADLHTMSPRLRGQQIGYLAQSPEIAWDVTVETLVSLGRIPWQARAFHPSGTRPTEDHAAVKAALTSMNLLSLRSRPVSQLSGGERARVLAARVLAGHPDWILADEPLANLDLAHATSLIRHLRGETKASRGIVVVLHDLTMAMNHADRVIVLNRGRVVADGHPETALSTDLIRNVWQAPVHWLGEPGCRALSVG